MVRRFAVTLLVAVSIAPPASACMANERYPTFWSAPPTKLIAGEVVLRVSLEAYTSVVHDEDHFATTCDGGSYVFRVVRVLAGTYSGKEIAIIHPVVGGFLDAPNVGDERIVVGKVLAARAFDARFTLEPNIARHEVGPPEYRTIPDVWPKEIGGPSSVSVLEVREPPMRDIVKTVFVLLVREVIDMIRRW